jgi:DNA-binding response OmpR family regulator
VPFPRARDEGASAVPPPLGRPRALVVGFPLPNASMLAATLGEAAVEAEAAADARTALERALAARFDLYVLDLDRLGPAAAAVASSLGAAGVRRPILGIGGGELAGVAVDALLARSAPTRSLLDAVRALLAQPIGAPAA